MPSSEINFRKFRRIFSPWRNLQGWLIFMVIRFRWKFLSAVSEKEIFENFRALSHDDVINRAGQNSQSKRKPKRPSDSSGVNQLFNNYHRSLILKSRRDLIKTSLFRCTPEFLLFLPDTRDSAFRRCKTSFETHFLLRKNKELNPDSFMIYIILIWYIFLYEIYDSYMIYIIIMI